MKRAIWSGILATAFVMLVCVGIALGQRRNLPAQPQPQGLTQATATFYSGG